MSAKQKAVVALSPEEEALLKRHESVISRGLQAFLAVGQALLEIRDRKLYRHQHKTFEDYCRIRWDMSRPRGYQLIKAAEIVQDLSTDCRQMVENESQARTLLAVPPHLRDEVVKRIEDTGESVTEQVVTRVTLALLEEKRRDSEEDEPVPRAQPVKESHRSPDPEQRPTLYVPRGHEQQRLALKDALAARPEDVRTKKDREIVQQTIEMAIATAERWKELL